MHFRRLAGGLASGLLLGASGVGTTSGCSATNNTVALSDGGNQEAAKANLSCGGNTSLADDDYAGCSPSCTFAPGADPTTCTPGRNVNACCVWVQEPRSTTELTRASTSDYHDYAAPPTSLTPDLGCLTTPAVTGPVHATTLTGYVKIFSSNPPGGTLGVTVQVFRVDTTTGALMGQVGSPYTTSKSDPVTSNHWLYNCETDACAFYGYTITGVPTETPLVIETSDGGPGLWANLYDYNIYFSDAVDCASAPTGAPCVSSATTTSYDVTAVVPADISTAATLAGGFTLNPTQGVIAGEVHDCGDVRIAGANVDLDKPYVGPLIYFDANETQPTPDEDIGQADEGTSLLGLFGALDLATGAPIRVSAIGNVSGKDTLLGTAIVQAYPGPSVTAITLRGRGPYQ